MSTAKTADATEPKKKKGRPAKVPLPETLTWTTEDERAYLDGMGTWSDAGKWRSESLTERRIRMLRAYIEASENRANWGDIQPEVVTAYAAFLLKKYEFKAGAESRKSLAAVASH